MSKNWSFIKIIGRGLNFTYGFEVCCIRFWIEYTYYLSFYNFHNQKQIQGTLRQIQGLPVSSFKNKTKPSDLQPVLVLVHKKWGIKLAPKYLA